MVRRFPRKTADSSTQPGRLARLVMLVPLAQRAALPSRKPPGLPPLSEGLWLRAATSLKLDGEPAMSQRVDGATKSSKQEESVSLWRRRQRPNFRSKFSAALAQLQFARDRSKQSSSRRTTHSPLAPSLAHSRLAEAGAALLVSRASVCAASFPTPPVSFKIFQRNRLKSLETLA